MGIPTAYGLSFAVAQLTGQAAGPVNEYAGYVYQFADQGVRVINGYANRAGMKLPQVVGKAVDDLLLTAGIPNVAAPMVAQPGPDTSAHLG